LQARRAITLNQEIAGMNKTVYSSPEPERAAADHTIEAERLRRRTCTKAADLRGALEQLLAARALASSEKPDPAGDPE
jgi:hypothetical protein